MATRNRKIQNNHLILNFLILNLSLIGINLFFIPAVFQKTLGQPSFLLILLLINFSWITSLFANKSLEINDFVHLVRKSKGFFLNVLLLVVCTYSFGNALGIEYFDRPIILIPIFSFAILNLLFVQSLFNKIKTDKK